MLSLLLMACAHSPPTAAPGAPGGVVQSPLDRRQYEVLTLDNGMRALLVSDPDTDMAAASLGVHVGHYADPADRFGLAHFLEHMLFMGTDRYPDADEYRQFVEAHGGQTNAGTGGETTQYFFTVEYGALSGAFDRFARFFVAPRLDPAFVERERNAVNSEYSLKVQDNARRARQVRKATTNPAHPESQFSVGNLTTLADRPNDPVYEDLRALYGSHYRADRMTVAVIGREPLDQLREMVRTGLSEVPNPPAAADPTRPPPFLPDQVGVRIDVVPLDVRREVELQFAVPAEREVWPQRPIDYVASVLGHEGEGTLFTALKEAGWIESIFVGTTDPADDYDLLSVNIGMTEQGPAHLDEIVAAVFADIAAIRAAGPEAFRVHEDRTVRSLAFQFAEETPPAAAVQNAADALWEFPPQNVLDAWARVDDLSPAAFDAVVSRLVPENLRLVVTVPGATTDRVEPLYDVPYAIRALTAQERAAFTGGTALPFALPGPNAYLPDDTRLARGDSGGPPAKLASGPVELWHALDTGFGAPRARVALELWSDDPRHGDRERTMVALLARQLDDELQAFRYPIERAGLDLEIGSADRGLTVTLSGYDDGLEPVLTDLVARIASFRVDPDRFALVRSRAVREWRNVAREWPIQQVRRMEQETLYPYAFQREAGIPIAESVTAEELQAFADGLLDGMSARMLVHGNVTAKEARALASVVEGGLLKGPPAPPAPVVVRRVGPAQVVRDVAIDHNDSTILVVYQGDSEDLAAFAKWRLLGQLLDTPFFAELRTKQQLGYNVYAMFARWDRLPGLRMGIQSGVADPIELQKRIDTFLGEQREGLAAMDEAAFATVRDGLVAQLRERDTQLYQRSDQLVTDLRAGVVTFDWDAQVADAVAALDRDTMAAFAREVLDPNAGRLVLRSFGRNTTRVAGGCADAACVAAKLPETWTRAEP